MRNFSSPNGVAVDEGTLRLRDSLKLVNVRDSNTEQQIHENQSHEHKKDEKKYFSSQSSLLIFHEAVGEVQFAHQHCQHLHEGVVQSVEAIRVWEEGVEHETEGDDEYPEGEEKSEGGHSNSPGPESSRTDQNISGIINLLNPSMNESNQNYNCDSIY